MELVTPALGTIVWMTIGFLILVFVLSKFAWKPILKTLKDREQTIENALLSAERTKEEMKKLVAGNEQLLKEAREERDNILREARQAKDMIVNEAKDKAKIEANAIVERALETIANEKMAAITELKNQIAHLSIEISEKILREEMKDKQKHEELINKMLEDMKVS